MANDKLFQKRKAVSRGALKRKKATRAVKKRALIVCEDSDSTPAYLTKLVSYFGLSTVDIKICGKECGSAPSSVVQYGEDYLTEKDDDFDYVFFVFDRDAHESYGEAIAKAKGLNKTRAYRKKIDIRAITSVPCFELWFKLHFDNSTKPYSVKGKKSAAASLIDDLKKIPAFNEYTKDNGCSYFDDIKELTDTAINNGEGLMVLGQKNGTGRHDTNPGTLVHEMVAILKDM